MHYPPTSICFGDSGGPLVCMQDSVPVITGVAHGGGYMDCTINTINKFVNVIPHLDWIKQNMVKLSHHK